MNPDTAPRTSPSAFRTARVSPAARLLRGGIRAYQAWSMRRPPNCRYEPSCSHYAATAISTYGAPRGSWMAIRRIIRCRPGGGRGYDPVPLPTVGAELTRALTRAPMAAGRPVKGPRMEARSAR